MKKPIQCVYGITTVPKRFHDTFRTTLTSLANGGFDKPHLFVDGCDPGFYRNYAQLGLLFTTRDKALGIVGNWVLSMYELYQRNPQADLFLLFQDDCICVKNLRSYIEKTTIPNKGYCNLYTMQANEPIIQGKPFGWHEASLCNPGQTWQTGRGAVGLLFTLEGLLVLLKQESLILKPQSATTPTRCIDGGIVNAMNIAGWREYVHNPSLIQHIGKCSTIGSRPHPTALSFPGENIEAGIWQ